MKRFVVAALLLSSCSQATNMASQLPPGLCNWPGLTVEGAAGEAMDTSMMYDAFSTQFDGQVGGDRKLGELTVLATAGCLTGEGRGSNIIIVDAPMTQTWSQLLAARPDLESDMSRYPSETHNEFGCFSEAEDEPTPSMVALAAMSDEMIGAEARAIPIGDNPPFGSAHLVIAPTREGRTIVMCQGSVPPLPGQ